MSVNHSDLYATDDMLDPPTDRRTTHIAWVKQRALQELEANGVADALSSLTVDLMNDESTHGHEAGMVGTMMMMSGQLSTPAQMRDFINSIQ